MNKCFRISFALLASLLLAGTALAQTNTNPNPPGADAGRADRHCTSTTLSTDASAPCSEDVLNDGSGNAGARITTQPSPGTAGTASTGAMGNTGATSMPSTGTVDSGIVSVPGAMGTGGASASGSVATPARR